MLEWSDSVLILRREVKSRGKVFFPEFEVNLFRSQSYKVNLVFKKDQRCFNSFIALYLYSDINCGIIKFKIK